MLTPKIDFQVINTYDPKVIVVVDSSRWNAIRNNPSSLEIRYEGNPIYVEEFKKEKINVIDSFKLFEVWDEELPDGLYKITLQGSPSQHYKERYVFRTQEMITRIDYMFNNSKEDKETKEYLFNLMYVHESIHALIRRGEVTKAKSKYKFLERLVKDFEMELSCKNC